MRSPPYTHHSLTKHFLRKGLLPCGIPVEAVGARLHLLVHLPFRRVAGTLALDGLVRFGLHLLGQRGATVGLVPAAAAGRVVHCPLFGVLRVSLARALGIRPGHAQAKRCRQH